MPRAEIFLADKLSFPQSYSAAGVRKSVADALRKMRVEYIDLYMLHSVGPSVAERHEAWREMVAMQKEGTLRHIGVSNFGTRDLRELKASSLGSGSGLGAGSCASSRRASPAPHPHPDPDPSPDPMPTPNPTLNPNP